MTYSGADKSLAQPDSDVQLVRSLTHGLDRSILSTSMIVALSKTEVRLHRFMSRVGRVRSKCRNG
jgi:hypothetical protein